MREATAQGWDWVPPETPSGAAAPVPVAWGDAAAGDQVPASPGSGAGVAVARGDARPTPPAAADGTTDTAPAAELPGNPVARLGLAGPGGVLDGGFELLRFRFWRLVGLTAVLVVPLQLIGLWIAIAAGTTASSGTGSDDLGSVVGPQGLGGGGWPLLLALARAVALCLLGMAVGHLLDGWLAGEDRTFGQALAAAMRRCWVAPVVVAVTLTCKVLVACLGGIGFFLADALFFTAGIVAGAERLGPFATVGRSFRLSRGAYGLALVTVIGGWVISQLLQIALTLGPVLLVASFQPPEGWVLVAQQVASLVLLVTLPLTACIAARGYVELRCRTEGFDLVRRQEERGLV